jgi:hypothetical protein
MNIFALCVRLTLCREYLGGGGQTTPPFNPPPQPHPTPQIMNNGKVLATLRRVGEAHGMAVRPYTVTAGAPLTSYLATMANTGVLVGRHGPLLANALFLPPGEVVMEEEASGLARRERHRDRQGAVPFMLPSLPPPPPPHPPTHTPPAGALVVELLPYNWEWQGVSELYLNLTHSLGDVHHVAWKATSPHWATYAAVDDERYSKWTAAECTAK